MKHTHTADELDYGITEIAGYTVDIEQDTDPEGSREWDNLGTMACWHNSYKLGDEQPSEDAAEYIRGLVCDSIDDTGIDYDDDDADDQYDALIRKQFDKDYYTLPLILYDHSGISMSTSRGWPYNCPWDAGQVGFIYVSKEKLKAEGLADRDPYAILKQEVTTYDQYLSGDVYSYTITDPDDGTVDGCCGFYGSDYVKEQAIEALNAILEGKDREHLDQVKTWIKNRVPYQYRTELN
jgi:hypothetical protein